MPVPVSPARAWLCFHYTSNTLRRHQKTIALASIEGPGHVSHSEPVLSVVCSSADAGGRGASNCGCRDRVSRLPILAGATSGRSRARAQRQVLETLDRLRTVIADVEAQRRGYLLTLDPSYLKAYGVSDESVRRDAQALQALVAGDPLQNHRAGHLALTVAAKLREIDDIVKTARTSSGPAALAMIRSLDEIRSQIDQMVDHERFLLVDQERRAEALERRKAWLIATAVVIVAVLAGVALALARLEAIRRRKAIAENVALQSDLLARDKKIRRLVDANIIGIIIWDLGAAFLKPMKLSRMLGYGREDLISGRIQRTS